MNLGQHNVTGSSTSWDRTIRHCLVAAGISGAMGISFGAFAAHGLQRLGNPLIVEWVKTGASYQLWHAAALLGLIGLAGRLEARWMQAVMLCFFFGALLFAGSLYAMALLQWTWLGIITPIGGIIMILGWILLIVLGWRTAAPAGRGL
jgi:uncharacterized membrane protein YgdD (TMEM256/DUF423 family)